MAETSRAAWRKAHWCAEVWIPSYIAYGLVDTMAPLYGVMAPKGNLGRLASIRCHLPQATALGVLVEGWDDSWFLSTMLKMKGLA